MSDHDASTAGPGGSTPAPQPPLGAPAPDTAPDRAYAYTASPAVGAAIPAEAPGGAAVVIPSGADGPPGGDAPDQVPTSNKPAAPRRWVRWLVWSLMIAALLAMLGVSAYLVVAATQWRGQVDDLMVINSELGQQVADLSEERDAAVLEAEISAEQVATATARITELANEEANAIDNQQIMVDYVEAALECADARQELIDVLTNSRLYFPGTTNAAVEREYTEYCNEIADGFKEFKSEEGLGE